MKLKKGKSQSLPLGRNNTVHQHRLGTDWLESSLSENTMGILGIMVNPKLQRHIAGSYSASRCWGLHLCKKGGQLFSWESGSSVSQGGSSFLLTEDWWGHIWNTVSSLGLTGIRETWTYWNKSYTRPERWLKDWSICHITRSWGMFSPKKTWRVIWRDLVEEVEPKRRRYCLNIRVVWVFFTCLCNSQAGQTWAQAAESLWNLHSWRYLTPKWMQFWTDWCYWPCFEYGIELCDLQRCLPAVVILRISCVEEKLNFLTSLLICSDKLG